MTFLPSNLASLVKSTVRIGMLTPTPSVSVPADHLAAAPAATSCSTSRRYLGSRPAWWTPMPKERKRRNSLPYGVSKRKSPIASRMRSRSSRRGDLHAGQRLRQLGALALGEVDDVDRRLAALRAAPRPSRGAASRGTRSRAAPGARSEVTSATSRPAARLERARRSPLMSPSVADISRNWVSRQRDERHLPGRRRARGPSSSGTRPSPRRARRARSPWRSAMLDEHLGGAAEHRALGVDARRRRSACRRCSAPKSSQSEKNFSEASALIGLV